MADSLWNVEDAAKFFKVAESTIYKWESEGKFGNSVRVLAEGKRKRVIRFIPEEAKKALLEQE